MSSLVSNGVQLLTRRGFPLVKLQKQLHVASVSCQVKKNYEEVRIPMPWGHVAGKWWGPQDQRPILCLHGWQESCGSFDPLMQHLPEDTSFLAIDFPGHGYSSHLPRGMYYHVMNAPIGIRRIQQYFNWPKVSFMSHSNGACLSFLFTNLYPADVDFLIQIDGLKPFSKQPGSAIESTVANIDAFLRYEEFYDNKTPPPTYTYEQMIQLTLGGSHSQGSLAPHNVKYVLNRIIRRSELDPTKYVFNKDIRLKARTLVGMQHDDICEYAKRVTCPMITIKSTEGSYFEKKKYFDDVLAILKGNNKHFEFVFVEGTHHVHVNEPEKVAVIVNQFLAKYDDVDRSVGGLSSEIIVDK